jgi:DNA-binding MarR family transcriptional regulator
MDAEMIEIAVLLRRAQLRKQLACDAKLSEWEMTMPQWGMLNSVAAQPDSSTHRLALITGQSDQAAGAVVSRLEKRGLLKRHSGAGKAILHSVTPQGLELLRECDQAVAEVMQKSLAEFQVQEIATLRTYLQRLAGPE